MPDAPEKPPYEVMLTSDDRRTVERLPRPSQREEAIAWLEGHLQNTPRALVTGKVKRLKAAYSHLYQIDLGDWFRIIYRVEESEKRVYIEYVGPHPDWRKSRGGRIRR